MACNASEALANKRQRFRITVGMATFRDFDTTAMTLQSLRIHHGAGSELIELVVVDNDPTSKAGARLRALCGAIGAKYIPFADPVGTSAPRDEIFRQATGDAVVVMDAHVLLPKGVLTRFADFAAANPQNFDLWHGPMLNDHATSVYATHFDPTWGDDLMFGKWGKDDRADVPNSAPFVIPGMGLGLFACQREAWLGFPENLKGFGGEELMIHEKFRQAGRKTLCLPFLRWWHLFRGNDEPAPYPLTIDDRFRNYLI
jgi:glycosyltransferase involved in cell wall biosynthesis